MRIKIIGENHCARATRHLLRLAGFAVTDFLPADAVIDGPAAGYAIIIDLFPALHTPNAHLGPDCATQLQASSKSEEADRIDRDASSSPFTEVSADVPTCEGISCNDISSAERTADVISFPRGNEGRPAEGPAKAGGGITSYIHFDSVDSALEAAVLRHVAQLAAGPVIVDRPGGVVHSERELRIVAPVTGDARVDEAAAVAIEFGVLRGLLDLVAPDARGEKRWNGAGKRLLRGDAEAVADGNGEKSFASRSRKSWWPFAVVLYCAALGLWKTGYATVKAAAGNGEVRSLNRNRISYEDRVVGRFTETRRLKPAPLKTAPLTGEFGEMVMENDRLKPVLLGAAAHLRVAGFSEAEPQGQFATGQGVKITDGVNLFVVDPCKAQTKLYASINQTGNTQLVAGTAAKKIYVCSLHVVAAAATNIAVVEGTGSVCATGTAGVSGFGGATAATGWNFAGNGGIALGNGDSSLGAEGTSGDNLCIFNSGSGQVSGGISYVVE
jgi:hypothetical protein